jgi:hypothetical protein
MMAHFYGVISGNSKTRATRCGTQDSGISAVAASWDGAVQVNAAYDEATKTNWAQVLLIPWHGKGYNKVIANVNLTTGEVHTCCEQSKNGSSPF